MLPIFTKPVELVAAADVEELVTSRWPEGYEVEFKKTLSHKRGGSHPWLAGPAEIGEHARDELLAEVIAFANARGGSVVLGIDETRDKPPRACALSPLPRVGELARRFEDQARSCIDPPLPRLQICPVEIDGRGGGVIVFRTAASRAAPHRLTTTLESYVRRGKSTMKMTMREIQDMTLNVARGLAGIDASFKRRRDAFHEWASGQMNVVAYRITALPLVDLPDFGRLFGRQHTFFPHPRDFKAKIDKATFDLRLPVGGAGERPRLRGVSRSPDYDVGHSEWGLYQSGLTDLWISARPETRSTLATPVLTVYHCQILAAVANVLSILDHYRGLVGVPEAEYGIEIEIDRFTAAGEPPVVYSGLYAGGGSDSYPVLDFPILLPRLSVESRREFTGLLTTVDIDVYDALGVPRVTPPPIKVDF